MHIFLVDFNSSLMSCILRDGHSRQIINLSGLVMEDHIDIMRFEDS